MSYQILEPEDNIYNVIMADITHRCNMECANCYLPNRDLPDMNFEAYVDFIKRLPKRTEIRFIGGEPTINPQLPEYIKITRELGHRPAVVSNGLRLAHMDYAKNLWDCGLRQLGISMNGVDNDDAYEILDSMRCATKKMDALNNCLNVGYGVNLSSIIVRGVNEDAPKRMLRIFESMSTGRSDKFYPHVFRFKNVGQIGRYMEDATIPMNELMDLVSNQLNVPVNEMTKHTFAYGHEQDNMVMFPLQTRKGKIQVKITNWTIDDEGIVDPNSPSRGRITQDFKIASFFEHVKDNEFGY